MAIMNNYLIEVLPWREWVERRVKHLEAAIKQHNDNYRITPLAWHSELNYHKKALVELDKTEIKPVEGE